MVLFTISSHKPQEYYPTSLKSEISKTSILKNIPVGATGYPTINDLFLTRMHTTIKAMTSALKVSSYNP
jgi:hypothetical protein